MYLSVVVTVFTDPPFLPLLFSPKAAVGKMSQKDAVSMETSTAAPQASPVTASSSTLSVVQVRPPSPASTPICPSIASFHSRRNPGVAHNINDGCVGFRTSQDTTSPVKYVGHAAGAATDISKSNPPHIKWKGTGSHLTLLYGRTVKGLYWW